MNLHKTCDMSYYRIMNYCLYTTPVFNLVLKMVSLCIFFYKSRKLHVSPQSVLPDSSWATEFDCLTYVCFPVF